MAAPKLAFLGPAGSHSHQCALDGFGESVEFVERPTITEAYKALASENVQFAVIPQENSAYGTVTETYDILRLPEVGEHIFVRGDITRSIRHCLVVRRGVKLEEVQRVLSHEQALGQCAEFLTRTLPNAVRIKTTSTSAAARTLLSDVENDHALESAAICSAACVKILDGLETLQENIQDRGTNRTRFYVLAGSLDVPLPAGFPITRPGHALVRISLKPTESAGPRNRLVHLVLSTILTTFGMPPSRIDRRPSLSDIPFEDVYMVELEDPCRADADAPISYQASSQALWDRMNAGVERIQAVGGDATVLGVW